MRKPSRETAVRWLSLLASLVAASTAASADYPSQPIKIITQAAAGSGPDVIGRIFADKLTSRLGQQVLIVNHPGAGGLIAAQAAATTKPDGYTLYMPSGSALMVLPETHSKLSFDFDRDFVSIGMVATQPMLIAASPKLGVSTLPELIELAKKRPGEILFAGNTRGTVPHLTGEMFRQRSGIDMSFVPYPGVAAALHDLMGGRISVIVESLSGLSGAIQNGTLKPLAVSSAKRDAQLPNVPTVAETIPGFEATGWFALLARAGTPDATVQKIEHEMQATLADTDLLQRFATLGSQVTPMSASELRQFIRRERKTWIPVIQKAGLASN